MLKYSWISNSKDFELIAFEGIANCYYYLERLKKCSFYHKRALCGKNEPDDSNVKSYLLKRYINKFFDVSLNVNTSSEQSNENSLGFEKQNLCYVKGLVHKERNFTINYSNVARYIKKVMPKLPTEDQIKVTRDSINSELYISVSTQSSLINPKWKERNKILGAFTIRMGTPINEIKDKDLPSPSLRGIGSNKDSEGQMQSKALEKIKSRISRNKENKEHFTIQEESKPEEVKQRKIQYLSTIFIKLSDIYKKISIVDITPKVDYKLKKTMTKDFTLFWG